MILTSRVDDAQMVEDDSPDGSDIAAGIQACLSVATLGMGVTLDHAVAGRLLGDSFREFSPQDSVEVVHRRLLELGPSLGMRVDPVNANLEQGIALVRPAAPVLHVRIVDKALHWLLLTDHRGRRIKVHSSNPDHLEEWMTEKQIAREFGIERNQQLSWLTLQPLLPCEALESRDHHGHSPHARYLKLLAAERSDIAVIVVFGVVVGLLALSTPIAVEALVNTVAFGQFVQPVIVLAMMLFVFLAFAAVMRAVQAYVTEIIQRRIFVRVASDLAQRLPRVPGEFWRHHYGPELINRFFEVVTVQKVTAQMLLDGLALVLQTVVGMTVIAFYHPLLLGFDAFLLLVIAGIVFVLGRGAVGTSVEESKNKYATAAWLEELARHGMTFKHRGAMKFAMDEANRRVTNYLGARQVHFRVLMRQIIATLMLQAVASTALLGLGGWLVIRGELALGQLVAAELIVTVIVGSFAKIGKYLESYYDVVAAMDKLGHLFDMPVDGRDGVEFPGGDAGVEVVVDDVAWRTAREAGAARSPVRLTIGSGQRVALLGDANQRSALLEVIGGFARPHEGHVELDGYDLRRVLPESLHTSVALVRRPEIFAGTIAENLHVGRHDVTEERIRQALAATCLLDELQDLPEGLSTPLETDGRTLSDEQVMRLMLARAVAGKPRLLLVDGALDALADERLPIIAKGIAEALPKCTIVIGTGRRDVARLFDRQMETLAPGVPTEGSGLPAPDSAADRTSRREGKR